MRKTPKKILSILLLALIIIADSGIMSAQNDAYFYDNVESRDFDDTGYNFLSDDYIFSYNLFEKNGFTFNGFENGNDNDGFTFNDFDYAPDNAPLGSGLLLLSLAGLAYAQIKRKREE